LAEFKLRPGAGIRVDTWRQIDHALRDGFRGLRGGSSLVRLLAQHRRARNRSTLPRLTCGAKSWHGLTNTGLAPALGPVIAADRSSILLGRPGALADVALREGRTRLPAAYLLQRLLEEHRNFRNRSRLPRLSIRVILRWQTSTSGAPDAGRRTSRV